MATVSGSITPGFSFSQTPSNALISGTPIQVPLTLNLNLGPGTAADKVDLLYAARLTFVASTAQTLDLTALTDVVGAVVNFARVRMVAIKVYSTTDAASLTVGNAGTNPWTGFLGATSTLALSPASASPGNPDGAWFVVTAPNTTGMATGGSSKNLKLLPSAHAFTADVVIAGCSV